MHTTENKPKPEPILSKRRLGWAGIAAFIGCAACCALPLLVLAFAGTGASAMVARVVRPGTELVVGVVVFAVTLGALVIRGRTTVTRGCGPTCKTDGSCCGGVSSAGA